MKRKLLRQWKKQGRIHSYRGSLRVGRGSDKKASPSIQAGAVLQKQPVNAKKATKDGPTH